MAERRESGAHDECSGDAGNEEIGGILGAIWAAWRSVGLASASSGWGSLALVMLVRKNRPVSPERD